MKMYFWACYLMVILWVCYGYPMVRIANRSTVLTTEEGSTPVLSSFFIYTLHHTPYTKNRSSGRFFCICQKKAVSLSPKLNRLHLLCALD